MSCSAPLRAVQSLARNSEGKRSVFILGRVRHDGQGEVKHYEERHWRSLLLPCGTCDACKLERSRQWAVRCMHEASMYDDNCFVTLTYADEHLPFGNSLCLEDFQKFMKRLRRRFSNERIRFFHCGEYGERFGRPHYHVCLFGFDFRDKVFLGKRKGLPVWRSPILEELWPFGRSEIGSVTFESAAYVARYVMKKVTGPKAEEHYAGREPEYVTMSRRPGIGRAWYEKFKDELLADSVLVRGRMVKPPRYYDVVRDLVEPEVMEALRQKRRERVRELDTVQRLYDKEVNTSARLSTFKRELE